ncbi:MAG: hypothetical protein AB8I08_17435 [Sandaracinaceae bacterium]
MAYRDELEALRARLAAAEAERDDAKKEARRLADALEREGAGRIQRRIDPRWHSVPGGEPTPVTIRNESAQKVEVLWLSYEGKERSAGTLVPEGEMQTQTYVGHCWRIVDAATGAVLAHHRVEPSAGTPRLIYAGDGAPETG